MDLKTMLLPEKTVTFDFPGLPDFNVELSFLSKESNQALLKKCQVQKFDTKTRHASTELDDELFLQLYVKAVIKGWKGLKLKYLRDLVLVEVPTSKEDEELEYTEENALELMKNSAIFDSWIGEVLSDLGNFTKSSSKKKSSE